MGRDKFYPSGTLGTMAENDKDSAQKFGVPGTGSAGQADHSPSDASAGEGRGTNSTAMRP